MNAEMALHERPSGVASPVIEPARITVHASVSGLESRWRAFESEADGYAYQSYDWIATWHRHCGEVEKLSPRIVWIEDARGCPLMLLPLGIQKRRGGRALVWLGGAFADYLGPLLAPACSAWLTPARFADLWRAVELSLAPFDLLCLDRQPEWIGAQRNPFLDLPCIRNPSSAHATGLAAPYEGFVRAKRGADWVRAERRKERRLAEQGKIEFIVADHTNFSELVDALVRFKSLRYRELGVSDLFAERAHCEFLRAMSAAGIENGFVRLFALKCTGRVIAVHWGLVARDRFYHMLPAYSRGAHRRYSPGGLLLRRMIEWAIAEGLRVFDFTIGDEPYKLEWCDREMRLYDCLHGRTPRGILTVAVMRPARTLKRAMKRNRLLFGFGKRLRAGLARRRRAVPDVDN